MTATSPRGLTARYESSTATSPSSQPPAEPPRRLRDSHSRRSPATQAVAGRSVAGAPSLALVECRLMTAAIPTGRRRRSRLRIVDLFDEMLAGLFARPMRSMLTTLGTVLGLASLIATIGLSRTAGSQIVDQFDELSATQVMISARSNGRGGTSATLPWAVEQRLDRLNGVVASGAVADV